MRREIPYHSPNSHVFLSLLSLLLLVVVEVVVVVVVTVSLFYYYCYYNTGRPTLNGTVSP